MISTFYVIDKSMIRNHRESDQYKNIAAIKGRVLAKLTVKTITLNIVKTHFNNHYK